MTSIIGTIVLTLFFAIGAWFVSARDELAKPLSKKKQTHAYITTVLILGFAVRVVCAIMYRGHETDMGCFSGWSDTIFRHGLGNFYVSEGFHDYPPGYVYIMYVLGAIKNTLNLAGKWEWLVLKMPSILADLGIGYIIYHASRNARGNNNAGMLATFFVLNPVIILNSSLWGQVDSVLAIFALLSVYFTAQKKFGWSFAMFAAAFLIKPQAAFFAPVLIFAIIEEVFLGEKFNGTRLVEIVGKAICAVIGMLVLFMPFGDTPLNGIEIIVNQYIDTMAQYNYLTVNAFNVYAVFGGNWAELSGFMSVFGYAMILAVVAFAGFVFFKSKNPAKHYIVSAIIVFGVYMLSVKMHERYAFPAIIMLIMVLAITPTTKNFMAYTLFSMAQFFNIAWILFVYETDPSKYFRSATVVFASILNVALFIWMMVSYYKDTETEAEKKPVKNLRKMTFNEKSAFTFRLSEKAQRITLTDLAIIVAISVIYGSVAFYKLGNMTAPESELVLTNNPVTVDFGRTETVTKLSYFLGARQLDVNRNIVFEFFDENKTSIRRDIYNDGSVFVWNDRVTSPTEARYVVISTTHISSETDPTDLVYLREVALFGGTGEKLVPDMLSREADIVLFDEQDLYSEKDYMAGTYFDEIYHPRTAYEFTEGMTVYEWTHPPLGKVLMSIGIMMFGMVPFGWRCVGTFVGVLMVAAIYLIAKRMLKKTWAATATTLLFAFDFMHFTQTRLATIDTYIVFFIILMYYYMYKYYKMSFYDTPLRKTFAPLALSGMFFGLGVASKWTGAYAGAGLAVIFFITVSERYKEYCYAKKNPKGETDGISHSYVIETFKKNTISTIIFCCIAFVAVPLVIYTLSYIPYMMTPSGEGIKTIITNAQSMMTYHSKTVADSTHPFSSYWFEWPVMYRPIYYYSNMLGNGLKQGISAFGNPAVWWTGIGAVAFTVAVAIIIPLRNHNYYGKSKAFIGALYVGLFMMIAMLSNMSAISDAKLVRFFPIMLLYAFVFSAIFILVLVYDYKLVKISERTALFLTIGFFAQLLPWTLVLRTTYIYHYFTCVPFVVLMLGFVAKTIYDNAENKKLVICTVFIYAAIAIALFVMFYPVLSGAPVSAGYVSKYLRWMQSWVLIS